VELQGCAFYSIRQGQAGPAWNSFVVSSQRRRGASISVFVGENNG
jgi:hypothetical protein